jgi:hypothetical protein
MMRESEGPDWAPSLEEELDNEHRIRSIRRILNDLCRASGKYSEELVVDERGVISLHQRVGDDAPPLLVNCFHTNQKQKDGPMTEDFYRFIQSLEKRFPGFHFTVEEDAARRRIKYTVSKE